jgi:chemotaxis response regulator CheB
MKTMLIVDDSSYMRDVIKIFVSKLDIAVIGEAVTGNDGVAQYIKHMPDIVTMDFVMEEGNGLEAIKAIMAHNPKASVVLISSIAGQNSLIEEALALGAVKVFKKPLDKFLFIDCIKELMKK